MPRAYVRPLYHSAPCGHRALDAPYHGWYSKRWRWKGHGRDTMDRANGGVPDDDLDSEQPDAEAYATDEADETDEAGDHFRPSPFEPDDAYDDYKQYGE